MTIANIINLINQRINAGNNSVSAERTLWKAILNESVKLYEVKEIDVNLDLAPTYLADNFDNTGLGKNAMTGFAICNGNNGTRNREGRTSIGYGAGYAVIGSTGGSADAVVVSHSHTYTQYTLDQEVSSNGAGVKSVDKNITQSGSFETGTTGGLATGKNMQPYIVTLFIQRIS